MEFAEIFKAIIFGIIEGITEWLPISSTGHMILADEFIKLRITDAFKEMFLVVIQLGAIMAVVLLYFNKLNPFSPKKSPEEKKNTVSIWLKVLIGVIKLGVLGVVFDDWLDENFYNYVTVSIMLIIYGILFIWMKTKIRIRHRCLMTFLHSLTKRHLVGLFQVLSLIPGTSVRGQQFWARYCLELPEYCSGILIFMSIPIMFGASALKLMKFGYDFTGSRKLSF